MTDSTTSHERPRIFPVTQWTLVLAAGATPSPESAEALERLCATYWSTKVGNSVYPLRR